MSKNLLREAIAKSFYKQMSMSEADARAYRELILMEKAAAGTDEPPTSDSKTGIDSVTGKDNSAEPAKKMVEDPEGTKQIRAQFLESAESLANQPEIIDTATAAKLAGQLEYAMFGEEGATFTNIVTLGMTGMGTNKEAIKLALEACPTLMDVSKVSYEFEKLQGMSLENAIEDEMNARHQNEFVRVPLVDKPFIKISGKPMSLRQWNTWIKENKPKTDKIKVDVEAATGTTSAKTTMGTLSSVGQTGMTTAATVAATSFYLAGKGAIVSSVALAGLGLPIAATAGLAAGAYYLLSKNDELDDEVVSALNPDAFKEYTNLFIQMEDHCRQQAKTYVHMVPEEEEPEPGEDPASKKYAPLPFNGLASPVIKNVQIAMNEYCITREISTTRIAEDGKWGPESQGRWIKKDRFVEHAILNHPVWKEDAGFKSVTEDDYNRWQKISAKVSGTFPGYTPTPKGMLAFCIDAYFGDTKYGAVDRGKEGGGGGGGAAPVPGRKKPKPGADEKEKKAGTSRGLKGPGDVSINITGLEVENVDSFRDLYGTGTTRLARMLIDRIKNKGLGPVIDQTTTITMVCKVKGGRVTGTAKRKGQFGNFKNFELGTWGGKGSDFGSFIMRMNSRLVADISNVKKFSMNITFPSGKYDQTK